MNSETYIFIIDDFHNEKRHSKKHNDSINTQNHDKKCLTFFLSQYIRMKMKAQKSIVLKRNLMSILLPIVKKVISNKINQIKSRIMRKIRPNKVQNTPKRVSDREIKSLENIINIPKIVTEPKVVAPSKIAAKPKIVIEKNPNYNELKNGVIKQLKKHFKKLSDAKKSGYLDEYKGIRDLEHLFEEINENDDDYYKPILVGSFKEGFKLYESRGDKNKTLSLEQYLNKIMPYLNELINNHKAIKNGSREWKIQLIAHINFVSLDTGVIADFYVRSENEEVRLGNETDDIVKSLINSFLNNYQKQQQVSREKSNLVFECVDLMSYQINKTSLKRGSSYTESPKWLADKKATINPKNTKCSACFAYSIIIALNHQNIKNHPERIRNIIPFVDQYNWRDIDFPAGIKDWKKFEKNNETIALNILQVPYT